LLLIVLALGRGLRPLERLAAAFGRIETGDYRARIPVRGAAELAALSRRFNRMAHRLEAMERQNRRMTEDLLGLQERERAEIARDLHDEVGPFLFAVKVDAARIERLAGDRPGGETAALARGIGETILGLQRRVRGLMGRLRPVGLAEFGLVEAIEALVRYWQLRDPDLVFEVSADPDCGRCGELVEVTAYRVVQEALSNAVRHGAPGHIAVRLSVAGAGEPLVLEVSDDGPGIAGDARPGFGLSGMRERVAALGGRLMIGGNAEGGVSVAAELPRRPLEVAARARDAEEPAA